MALTSITFDNNTTINFNDTGRLSTTKKEIKDLTQGASTITISTASQQSITINVNKNNKKFLSAIIRSLQSNTDSSILSNLGKMTIDTARKIFNNMTANPPKIVPTLALYKRLASFFNKKTRIIRRLFDGNVLLLKISQITKRDKTFTKNTAMLFPLLNTIMEGMVVLKQPKLPKSWLRL